MFISNVSLDLGGFDRLVGFGNDEPKHSEVQVSVGLEAPRFRKVAFA